MTLRTENLAAQLVQTGLTKPQAERLSARLTQLQQQSTPSQCWEAVTKELTNKNYPFSVHFLLYKTIYPHWETMPAPASFPNHYQESNIVSLMKQFGCQTYDALHQWSVAQFQSFWSAMVERLAIRFQTPVAELVDLSAGVESPKWFPGARLNIVQSCFNADPASVAIISQGEEGDLSTMTYAELDALSNRVANSLSRFKKGDKLAMIMPMTVESVVIYLGIVKAGCVVVGIPDSFAADEIAARLTIANCKAVFCQHQILRDQKVLPLYERVLHANPPFAVVLRKESGGTELREQDVTWETFLSDNTQYEPVTCEPQDHINILFSSGTTAAPKAIPWSQVSPIKCASDAYLHHDLKPGNVFCWPTNLGWMMGPWLIFAALINKATIALYVGAANSKRFGEFVQKAKVTHLGVIPTLVKSWRAAACFEGVDLSAIHLFSSTGERSNIEDMLYLMYLTDYRPIIEYCGGTEIGGGYVTGTLLQPCAPAAFTTPALGIDFVILDEHGKISDKGEVAIIPPSIGLSTELLNKDHHELYYAEMPAHQGIVLRRHGDEIRRYPNGFYRLLGRVDDTMKLSGIKVSSAEIEGILNSLPDVYETAAVAINPPDGGPSQLVIYVVLEKDVSPALKTLRQEMQLIIKKQLNPLFKIHEVIVIDALPRTASNKIIRRALREEYQKK